MAFPSVPFAAVNFRAITPTIVNKSLSGIENRSQVASSYFAFTASFQNMTDSQRRQIIGFLMGQRGNLTPFTIALPDTLNDSSGGYSGTISSASATAGTFTATGTVSSSNALILKAGDLIQFGNHTKIYMVTSDATSVGTSLTINLFPAIRTTVSSGAIAHTALEMTVRCTNDQIEHTIGRDMFANFDLDFEEVLA
jgi:hypothetical protein